MSPDIPSRRGECSEQASRKDSARLQRVNAENLARMRRVVTPLVDDIEYLGSDNAAQDHENPQVPCLVAINSKALGIAYTDPQSDQDSKRNEESVCRKKKLPYVKQLWEHSLIRCVNQGICYSNSLAGMQLLTLSP